MTTTWLLSLDLSLAILSQIDEEEEDNDDGTVVADDEQRGREVNESRTVGFSLFTSWTIRWKGKAVMCEIGDDKVVHRPDLPLYLTSLPVHHASS